jgi:hypothetical protein
LSMLSNNYHKINLIPGIKVKVVKKLGMILNRFPSN